MMISLEQAKLETLTGMKWMRFYNNITDDELDGFTWELDEFTWDRLMWGRLIEIKQITYHIFEINY